MTYWLYVLPLALFAGALTKLVIENVRGNHRARVNHARLVAAVEAEAGRWRPVFWSGCHEYQQHEDGRRRAVRVMDGMDALRLDWLGIGEDVQA